MAGADPRLEWKNSLDVKSTQDFSLTQSWFAKSQGAPELLPPPVWEVICSPPAECLALMLQPEVERAPRVETEPREGFVGMAVLCVAAPGGNLVDLNLMPLNPWEMQLGGRVEV